MADGRKNNGGHKTAGRKPKADEIHIIEQMDAVAAPKEVWEKLWALCESGDVQALKTWVNYRFGMPKQNMNIKVSDPLIFKLPTKDAD
jgi:NADPH-dependent ferric siderophore reductase